MAGVPPTALDNLKAKLKAIFKKKSDTKTGETGAASAKPAEPATTTDAAKATETKPKAPAPATEHAAVDAPKAEAVTDAAPEGTRTEGAVVDPVAAPALAAEGVPAADVDKKVAPAPSSAVAPNAVAGGI